MQFFVGTSGYSYSSWKGTFYPEKLPPKEMLRYYAGQFSTVEMNDTFQKLPAPTVLQARAEQVPKTFRFAAKAPQTITHRKRLKDVGPEVEQFVSALAPLKRLVGPLLFQLPPNFKKDIARLQSVLALVKSRLAAFEFRHASWFDDEVFGCLRKYRCPLCVADAEGGPEACLVSTASWGYARLRRDVYTTAQLKRWVKRIRGQNWETVYVYFKHDEVGLGPKMAARFVELANE